jgi:hypothetical protein
MRKQIFLFVLCSSFLYTIPVVRAQSCAESITYQNLRCRTQTCQDSWLLGTPHGGELSQVECEPQDCCGQIVSFCTLGDDCGGLALKDPAVRERVARAAAKSRILVADCKGRYVVYMPPRTVHTVPVLAR